MTETNEKSAADREPVIDLRNVSKIYGEGETEIRALDNFSMEVFPGEILTIMGPSGSGKSTLLNILGGMDIATSGSVSVDNVDLMKVSEKKLARFRKQSIGFVFQNFYLLPNLDILNNVLSPLIPYKITSKDKATALNIIERVGLKGREYSTVRKLSGGQSQRVAIARALINNPKILFADEPTGNLDSEIGKSIIDLLIELAERENKTIVIVTHDLRIGSIIQNHPRGRNVWLKDGVLSETPTYDLSCFDF